MRAALTIVVAAAAVVLFWMALAPPDYGRQPVLAAVVDGGKMEEFLETSAEKEAILRWVADGAPESGWPAVSTIFEARCTTCHQSEASFEMLPLDRFAPAARAAKVRPVLLEKITGGTMGEYLESAAAQAELVSWIEAGAAESEWPRAKTVLDAHCIHCHNAEGVQGIVSLEVYRSVSRLATLPQPAAKPLWAPGLVLGASLLALGRRPRPGSGRVAT